MHVLSRSNEAGTTAFGTLERRFPGGNASPPQGLQGGIIGSPIPAAAAEKMSDADWLRALRKYSVDRLERRGGRAIGGATELAQLLSKEAESDPVRFTALGLQFDESIHSSATDAVIRAVASKIGAPELTELCKHAHQAYGSALGRAVCWAAQQCRPVTDGMATLVTAYSADPDPEQEWAQTTADSGEPFYGGDIDSAGLNCVRGHSALAAASALFESDQHLGTLGPVIEQLACDPILAVRACAAEGVLALMNYEPGRAYSLAEQLLAGAGELYDSRRVERLLSYLIVREPNRVASHLANALAGPPRVAQRAGHVWALGAVRDGLPTGLPATAGELSVDARRGAAEFFAHNVEYSAEQLPPLFDDAEADIRKEASWAMRGLGVLVPQVAEGLITAFMDSRAFSDNFDGLVDALYDLPDVPNVTVVEVCRRAVEVAGSDIGDIRTARSTMGQPITRVLLRAYRQGGGDLRKRCLDVIDRLSELNAYGLDEALRDQR